MEQRLAKCPAGVDMPGKPPCILVDESSGWEKKLSFNNGRHATASGAKLYWETFTPIDKSKTERVIVFFHGLTDNVGEIDRFCLHDHFVARGADISFQGG